MNQNYLDGVDIIYWINLNRATDRRKKMEKILEDPIFNKIKKVRISGLDAKYKNPRTKFVTNITDLNHMNRTVNDSQYAILYSHLETIRTFSNTNYENALIFEDDLSLDYKKYWKKSIQDIIKNAPSDWEIIKLSQYGSKIFNQLYTLWEPFVTSMPKNTHDTKFKWRTHLLMGDWLAHGYVINNKAAKKLIHSIYKNNKYVLSNEFYHVSDAFIFQSLKTYIYKYPYFTYNDNNISYNSQSKITPKFMTKHKKYIKENTERVYKKTRKVFKKI